MIELMKQREQQIKEEMKQYRMQTWIEDELEFVKAQQKEFNGDLRAAKLDLVKYCGKQQMILLTRTASLLLQLNDLCEEATELREDLQELVYDYKSQIDWYALLSNMIVDCKSLTDADLGFSFYFAEQNQ